MCYNADKSGKKEAGNLSDRWRAEVVDWGRILAGLILGAFAYRLFLVPNEVAPGGFTGIGQILNALFGWNVGTVALALNVPSSRFRCGRWGCASASGRSLRRRRFRC
jgi:hypothetical protein